MNKNLLKFVISHLKKAIYNLENANRLTENPDFIDAKIIDELKLLLVETQIEFKQNNDEL